ncbi:MAG TPA: hypothetical protein VFB38_12855 [Chthonomonadaceae bacterium]|nr:hypothetical protein [Chthonomonadaceae bacterium]
MAKDEMFPIGRPKPSPAPIPEDHPLRTLFRTLVARAFDETLGISEPKISRYLADMLTDFAHCDNLYRIHNRQGVRLEEVAAMLMEADVALNATSFERERAVHKHIGDFTLFWAGIYPEALLKLRAPGRADSLIDYVRQGKKSYYIVSTFQYGPYAPEASLFRQLSEEFELCQYGLNLVRRQWEHLAQMRQRL